MSDIQDVAYKPVETVAPEGPHIQDQIIDVVGKRIETYSKLAVKVLGTLGFTNHDINSKEGIAAYKELLAQALNEHRSMEHQVNLDIERMAAAQAAAAAANPATK